MSISRIFTLEKAIILGYSALVSPTKRAESIVNMLKDSVWSFFKPWTSEQESWCRQALIEYNDKEYNDFINYCESRIDNLYNDNKEY